MKIAYGVMGYGRGHAMRSSAVLPSLMQQHEVQLFAGNDARQVLQQQFPVTDIPVIHYHYNAVGRISTSRTMRRNFKPSVDALFGVGESRKLDAALRRFKPDVVISDSETFTHRAARRLGIPRISFDHVGIMAYCKPSLPPGDWWLAHRDSLGYRAFMGWPERILISSFFPAIARRADIEIIAPLMRDRVVQTAPSNQGHLLAYFNKGQHQYLPSLESTLKTLSVPIKVYGTGREGRDGNLQYCPFSADDFIRDLASAHVVLATAGSQLIGEALYLGKPMYLLPENCFEQRMNADMVRRMGVGDSGRFETLNSDDLEEFCMNAESFRQRIQPHRRDGREQALTLLNQWIAQLTNSNKNSLGGQS